MGFFTYAQDQVESLMDGVVSTAQSSFADSLSTVTSTAITLYIVIYGYMVLAGKINSPLKELIWKGASFIIILAFVNNVDGLLKLAGEAVQELSTIGSGGSDVGMAFLDTQFRKAMKLGAALYDKGNIVSGSIAFLLIVGGFGLLFLTIFSVIVISQFITYFLLAFAPLFIFCLMWGWLKDSFAQYLSALLGNALILITVRMIANTILTYSEVALNNGENSNVLLVGTTSLIFCIIFYKLIYKAIDIVSNLSKVTVDKFPSQANKSNLSAQQAQSRQEQVQQQQTQLLQNMAQSLEKLTKEK
ncbi:type IV secretion system protein [Aggregatibacter actinomycetemcomitans]|uniref:type IV secretion system protein n=1 Tax=Aggregatibacter actinomycetemcomitans TaxID=714 RepID=UPI00197C3172|nr:type IV secretion system protein [Aggregatibacter actinomycetemcomitans]MBN6080098.1 type IV secretion system protein [Aggregatibacter actinomycetemcomitans]